MRTKRAIPWNRVLARARPLWILAAVFLASLALAARVRTPREMPAPPTPPGEPGPSEWTCAMHPQIRQPTPGLCPICAMELIPVGSGRTDPGPRAIALSATARERAGIETAAAARGPAEARLRLSGTLAYADTHRHAVSMLAGGQVRTLHAYTPGVFLRAGAPLAEIYSPEVLTAAQELIALRDTPDLIDSARRRLSLLGVDAEQIAALARAARAPETFTLKSPINGVVLSVEARAGAWISGGGTLLEIADPSMLWLQFDVFEQDAAAIRVGQTLDISVEALPGESFGAKIAFVPPELDPTTRSLKVRAEVPNPGGRLKPGYFARAEVAIRLADDALLVPATAVLQTGARAIVFVQSPDDPAVFESRIVVPGPRAGEQYIIREGLAEGERVATRGAFRIDSTFQLFGKPSMMSLPSEDSGPEIRAQTHCPIAGGEIDRTLFVDFEGLRIYFCCPGCDEDFLKEPAGILNRMRAEGIEPEAAPVKPESHLHRH